MQRDPRSRFPQKQRKHKINGEVRFPLVRLVGQGEPKVISSFDASKIAESLELDLILINEAQDPPVVRIGDYNKFIYEFEKNEKERKKKAHKVELKEIQLSCEIGDNDLLTKSRKAKEFLNEGDKVRVIITLKGRQMSMPERGKAVMEKFIEILSEDGTPEAAPKLEGNRWGMIMSQKKNK